MHPQQPLEHKHEGLERPQLLQMPLNVLGAVARRVEEGDIHGDKPSVIGDPQRLVLGPLHLCPPRGVHEVELELDHGHRGRVDVLHVRHPVAAPQRRRHPPQLRDPALLPPAPARGRVPVGGEGHRNGNQIHITVGEWQPRGERAEQLQVGSRDARTHELPQARHGLEASVELVRVRLRHANEVEDLRVEVRDPRLPLVVRLHPEALGRCRWEGLRSARPLRGLSALRLLQRGMGTRSGLHPH
mmetsp:Transcript_1986/g.4644  ORF Transcript_1986/g.4644 Transcript_1986/m.4644 type:complete len:243 (-) Transcript_1986:58-786(-)